MAGNVEVANVVIDGHTRCGRAVRTGHGPDGGLATAGPDKAGPDSGGTADDGVETIDADLPDSPELSTDTRC